MLFIPVVRSIRILLQPMVFITFPVGVEWLNMLFWLDTSDSDVSEMERPALRNFDSR